MTKIVLAPIEADLREAEMSLEDPGFCDDPFWDSNKTWFTENPDFTTW